LRDAVQMAVPEMAHRPSAFGEKRQAMRATRAEKLAAFALVAIGYAAYGVQADLPWRVSGDALSRVANAAMVTLGRHPHLGAIGLVWNPLPSLMELPLTLLRPLWPALVTRGEAGVLAGAFMAALGMVFLLDLLAFLGIGRGHRCVWAFLYALNPLIFIYGVNGMSDLMLMSALMGSLAGVVGYLRQGNLRLLASGGIWLALALGFRYEAVPLAMALAFGMALGMRLAKEAWPKILGTTVILLTPIVFAGFVWILLNALIMKNPLYFLDSVYSNAAQLATGSYAAQTLAASFHHPLTALRNSFSFAVLFWPLIPAFGAALILGVLRRRDPLALTLVATLTAVPVLQAAMLDLGRTALWDRFFISNIPIGFALVAYAATSLGRGSARRQVFLAIATLLLAAGDLGTGVALTSSPVYGKDDGSTLSDILKGRLPPSQMAVETAPVIAYLDAHPHLTVLTDTFTSFPIVISVENPDRLVITSDPDFQSILQNPAGRVDAILVPRPSGVADLDAVNRQWPSLWAGNVPWAHLLVSFRAGDRFRIYRVGIGAP